MPRRGLAKTTVALIGLMLLTAAAPTSKTVNITLPALDQVCKDSGVLHAGSNVVSPQESQIHDTVRGLRAAKAKLASEAVLRRNMDDKIQSATQTMNNMEARFEQINDQLIGMRNSAAKEELIEENNALVGPSKRQAQTIEDLKTQKQKLVDSRSVYVNRALDGAAKADEASHAYDAVSKDPTLAAAITKFNLTARFKVKLGPTSQFLDDLAFIKKCSTEVVTADIPLVPEQSTPTVEVTLNNKVTKNMIWDSGASLVSLSASTASAIGLVPGAKDRKIELTIANGNKVKASLMTLDSVRVGTFTVAHVQCVVMPADASGEDLLGDTFQEHFLAKMDLGAGKLHLTPLDLTDSIGKKNSPTFTPTIAAAPPPEVVAPQHDSNQQSDLAHRMGDISNWAIKDGNWSITPEGKLRGEGDSEIRFKPDLPGNITFSFKMTVKAGKRPRIFLDGAGDAEVGLCNEGKTNNLYVYRKVINVVGDHFPYEIGDPLAVSMKITDGKFEIQINNQTLTGDCEKSDKLHLRLRAGDNVVKGIVEFYDFTVNATAN